MQNKNKEKRKLKLHHIPKIHRTVLCKMIIDLLPKFLCTINNEIIFKNSTTDLKLAIFIHIKIYKIKTILVSGLHFPSSVV